MGINREISAFNHGVENLLRDELINQDAASDSLNWYNQDGRLILIPGKILVGQQDVAGKITGHFFGYKADGTHVQWRKVGAKIQYLNNLTWTDVITGLTPNADYSFTNFSSLAGTFTYAIGVDGIFKMHNGSPNSYNAMYNILRNFKGKGFIDKGRMILWDTPNDKTSIRGSWIDSQSPNIYTTVTAEATTSLGGTLAFKAGGATRNCFGVTLTLTASTEIYTDNYAGVLKGSLGGTGTINYITGAYTVSNAGAGTVNYQWEDSNQKGVTDFTHSAVRVAGEGFQFPQDDGGDPILNVLIGSDGYYSMKSGSAYRLILDTTDLNATNLIYRKQMGVSSYRSSLSTEKGIFFMDTSNNEKPEMTILEPNTTSTNLVPRVLFPQFRFANYAYDDCTMESYERYIIVACKSLGASNNDTLLLCDETAGTVNITSFSGRTFAFDSGKAYMGSSVTQNVYQIFSGFDDDGLNINNFWRGKGENFAVHSRSLKYMAFGTNLKKERHIRLRGKISSNQKYQVYISYDDAGFQLVGTVLGNASYVDASLPETIGSEFIGNSRVGGNIIMTVARYEVEIRLHKVPKFVKRTIKFVALGIGYISIEYQMDWDISVYEGKIPARFRQKQRIGLDGILITTNTWDSDNLTWDQTVTSWDI